MYKDRFKKFGGSYIPDIIQYLADAAEKDPTLTITVGCDSIQARRKTIYAIMVHMLFSSERIVLRLERTMKGFIKKHNMFMMLLHIYMTILREYTKEKT